LCAAYRWCQYGRSARSDSPLRVGSYRSLGGAVNHFARESHVDEIAHAVGMDPVELRLRNLTNPRLRRVLGLAADRFGWAGARPPSDRGVGVAIGVDVGSYAAMCIQADVQGSEVKVGRVVTALDCGLTVNPEGARNQVEGSIIMGMGTALYEAIEFRGGSIINPGFVRYRVPRITDAPAIEVALAGDADEPSTGAGEPGIVPVAAAIANAVFDQTGRRVREPPLRRHLRIAGLRRPSVGPILLLQWRGLGKNPDRVSKIMRLNGHYEYCETRPRWRIPAAHADGLDDRCV